MVQNTLLVVIVIPCKFQESLMYDFRNTLIWIANATNTSVSQCYKHILQWIKQVSCFNNVDTDIISYNISGATSDFIQLQLIDHTA